MQLDSIGFDLDGTLWNPISTITKAWDIKAQRAGAHLPSQEEMSSVMGLNQTDLMNKLYPDMNKAEQDKFFEDACIICDDIIRADGGILFPKLEETLAELSKEYKLYIVSNCQEGYIEAFFAYHKLEKYFTDFQYSGKQCRPKGENIKSVIERNGLKANTSIYIGDTQGDADAARLAGIPFVFAEYGFGTVDKYDYKINNFEEILKLVKE